MTFDLEKDVHSVVKLVADSKGKVVGRTRLQKIACLLEITGLGDGFEFEYRHYGPYSEQLAEAASFAVILGEIEEEERVANWGGKYSIFELPNSCSVEQNTSRTKLIEIMNEANSVVLELAATAAFLAIENEENPWEEVVRRKPSKSGSENINCAKELYAELSAVETPKHLPIIS